MYNLFPFFVAGWLGGFGGGCVDVLEESPNLLKKWASFSQGCQNKQTSLALPLLPDVTNNHLEIM